LAHLVRCEIVVDAVEGFAQVVEERVGGGEDKGSGLDLDGAVASVWANFLIDQPGASTAQG
jgi:hypothetical protein